MRQLSLWIAIAGMTVTGWSAEEIYKEDFTDKTAWTAVLPAELSPYGRSGSALKISTYVKDGEKSRWDSPSIAIKPGICTVSAWLAANLAYTQDPGYGGALAAVLFDKDGKEIRREELVKIFKPDYRDNWDFYAIPAKGGLVWRYYEAALDVPADAVTLKLVFTWSDFVTAWRSTSKNVRGEVYLDDVMVTAGKPKAPPAATTTAPVQPRSYRLRLNTPVQNNIFLPSDPLEITVRLDGTNGPPPLKPGLILRYRVEDYQCLLIDQGTLPLAQPVAYYGDPKDCAKLSLLKTFYLGEKVRQEVGRWMAIRVTLEDNGKIVAEGENALGLCRPRRLTSEQQQRLRFFGEDDFQSVLTEMPTDINRPWGQISRLSSDEMQGKSGLRILAHDKAWPQRQPTRESPISFTNDSPTKSGVFSQQTFEFHERDQLGMVMFRPAAVTPAWALIAKSFSGKEFLDAAAYGAYVEAVVRHSRAGIYVVMDWEGHSIETQANAVRAAYAAVKRVDPRLKVGTEVDTFRGQKFAQELCDSGIIDFVDICIYDYYSSRTPPANLAFRRYLEERGKYKEYWNLEYQYTGSKDQEEWTRRTADFIVYAFMQGLDKMNWYQNHFTVPTIRSPLTDGVVYGMKGMLKDQGEKLSAGLPVVPPLSYTEGYARGNFFPFLQWMMHYHLTQLFGLEDFRGPLAWGAAVEGGLFDGPDYSTAAVWRPTNAKPVIMTLDSGGIPYTVWDMYGRSRHIMPVGGKSLVMVGPDPLLFRFDDKVPALTATPAATAFTDDKLTIAAGFSGEAHLRVANEFGVPFAATVKLTVDDSWKVEPAQQGVNLATGGVAEAAFKITAPADAMPGVYPLLAAVDTVAGPAAWLHGKVTIAAPVEIKVAEQPYTTEKPAAVLITVVNHSDLPVSGTLCVEGDFGGGLRPDRPEAQVTVPKQGEQNVEFPIKDWKPDMNRDYQTKAILALSDGRAIAVERPLSFRGVVKCKKPFTIDGNLDDWDLKKLVPCEFFRLYDRGGAANGGFDFTLDTEHWSKIKDTSVKFYTQWDDEYLYFAFVIKDDQYRGGGKGVEIWSHDAVKLCLYPTRVQSDLVLGGIAYTEHIGLDQDGKPTFDRCNGYMGNWGIGSGQPEGVKVAVKPAGDGAIVEVAVPFKQYAPLEARVGSRFALAMMYYDADEQGLGMPLMWYYALSNTDMNPARFGNFMLIE